MPLKYRDRRRNNNRGITVVDIPRSVLCNIAKVLRAIRESEAGEGELVFPFCSDTQARARFDRYNLTITTCDYSASKTKEGARAKLEYVTRTSSWRLVELRVLGHLYECLYVQHFCEEYINELLRSESSFGRDMRAAVTI